MPDQQKYTQKLAGQRVLIIGGSSGIGFAVTEALTEHGASVFISSSNADRVSQAIESLRKAYPSAQSRIAGYPCDLGSPETVEINIQQLFDQCGDKLDHIVFTAADSLATMDLETATVQAMHAAGLLRLFAPMLVAKVGSKYLNPGPNSSITFTTGSVADRPLPGWSIIGSFATAIQGMTRGLALDLKPIRVNCIAPGVVDTKLWTEEQKAQVFPVIRNSLPTGQIGQVEDVAEAYLYVVKDRYISGSCINTNGGQLLV